MERIIDLHIHSTCSDGFLSPKEIVLEAEKNHVSVISIADHDTVAAYTDDLLDFAKQHGVKIIPAVEMSTHYFGVGIHVLGYNIDTKNSILNQTLFNLQNARQKYLVDVSKKLEELGYAVNLEKLKTFTSVTKAHIAIDVVENIANKNLLVSTFGYVPTKDEFIETIMNENCPAYVKKFSITPAEASEAIRAAGGKVSLAHPVAYKHEDGITESQVLELAKSMNADAIETNYLYVNRKNELIDETAFWNEFASKNGYFATVGSDFHKTDSVRPKIGFVNTKFKLSEEKITEILKIIEDKK